MSSPDLTKLSFLSSLNYMKRDSSVGSAAMTIGGAGVTVTKTIAHNLGYIPFYEIYTEIDNAGIVWNNTKIYSVTDTSSGASQPPDADVTSWIDTANLTINLVNNSSPNATGSRTVYWLIYRDYGNV